MFFSSQQVDFNTTFYSSPAVLVSFHHYYNRQANHLGVPQESNIITAWVEVRNSPLLSCMFSNNNVDIHVWIYKRTCLQQVNKSYLTRRIIYIQARPWKKLLENLTFLHEIDLISMRICVKDMSGTGTQHDPLSVSYVVIGGNHK